MFFADGAHPYRIAPTAEDVSRIGTMQMESAIIKKFVSPLLQFECRDVVSALPEN